jgi:hypothetical protein
LWNQSTTSETESKMKWHHCIDSAQKLALELCGERGDAMPWPPPSDEGEGDGAAAAVSEAFREDVSLEQLHGDGYGDGDGFGEVGDGYGIGYGFEADGDGWSCDNWEHPRGP